LTSVEKWQKEVLFLKHSKRVDPRKIRLLGDPIPEEFPNGSDFRGLLEELPQYKALTEDILP